MKNILHNLLRAFIVWGTAPDGAEWNAAAENIFADQVQNG